MKNKQYLKEGIRDSWNTFISIAGREGRETWEAIKIIKKILSKKDVTQSEIKYLKKSIRRYCKNSWCDEFRCSFYGNSYSIRKNIK